MKSSFVRTWLPTLGTVALSFLMPRTAAAEDAINHTKTHAGKNADESFKPIKEADLPQGYPTYTKVGEIEVKDYPASRLARSKDGSLAFWELFAHIKAHNIEMSAPVQMDYPADSTGKPKQASMAFLYGDPKVGKPGKDGPVEVVDLPAIKVVCIGMNGSRSEKRLMAARAQLDDWLKRHSDAYEAAGAMRVMGYNSPFIPVEKQFYEVQIPVKAKKK